MIWAVFISFIVKIENLPRLYLDIYCNIDTARGRSCWPCLFQMPALCEPAQLLHIHQGPDEPVLPEGHMWPLHDPNTVSQRHTGSQSIYHLPAGYQPTSYRHQQPSHFPAGNQPTYFWKQRYNEITCFCMKQLFKNVIAWNVLGLMLCHFLYNNMIENFSFYCFFFFNLSNICNLKIEKDFF